MSSVLVEKDIFSCASGLWRVEGLGSDKLRPSRHTKQKFWDKCCKIVLAGWHKIGNEMDIRSAIIQRNHSLPLLHFLLLPRPSPLAWWSILFGFLCHRIRHAFEGSRSRERIIASWGECIVIPTPRNTFVWCLKCARGSCASRRRGSTSEWESAFLRAHRLGMVCTSEGGVGNIVIVVEEWVELRRWLAVMIIGGWGVAIVGRLVLPAGRIRLGYQTEEVVAHKMKSKGDC